LRQEKHSRVAYLCMEYGLTSDFKLYAGGLGILAGDYLKAASDMQLPVTGIGILWRQGYTRQIIDSNGNPVDSYPIYDYDFLQDTGIKVKVRIRERDVFCKVWRVECFNNAPLYLLDTYLPENQDPWITGQLYGWFAEERIAQEMVLGIGGIRALRRLGIEIDVYHFNEGHAVFAGLELIREKMEGKGLDFKEAWKATREEIVFTTHTPVIEGNEEHPLALLKYMGADQNLTLEEMIEIGGAPFNMTVAALRLSYISNGVSQLHTKTANKMWDKVSDCSEIIAITNGVHLSTWVADEILAIYLEKERLWSVHQELKKELIDFIAERTGRRLKKDSLLIGFARRAAPYKRGNFIFSDEEKIAPFLQEGMIQLIISGKAHPLDKVGKNIVKRQVKYSRKYPDSVIFLEDYDMETARYLTRGCDVWLNNPIIFREACGTSGIKAAMNGVLNVSTLDGWWPEVCQHDINGWQIESASDSLYQVLLNQVLPTYYHDRRKWIKMMQTSIKSTLNRLSARRMLKDYFTLMYDKKMLF